MSALDATAALAAAEPGAFLERRPPHDPEGSRRAWRGPWPPRWRNRRRFRPARCPRAAPSCRSPNPLSRAAPTRPDKNREARRPGHAGGGGSSEWVQVALRQRRAANGVGAAVRRGVKVVAGGRGDAVTFTAPRAMMVLAPVPAGDRWRSTSSGQQKVVRLRVVARRRHRLTLPPRPGRRRSDGPERARDASSARASIQRVPGAGQRNPRLRRRRRLRADLRRRLRAAARRASRGDPRQPRPTARAASSASDALAAATRCCGADGPARRGAAPPGRARRVCE